MPTGVSRRYRVSYGEADAETAPRMADGRHARLRAELLASEHGAATLWRRAGGAWVVDATYRLLPTGRVWIERVYQRSGVAP